MDENKNVNENEKNENEITELDRKFLDCCSDEFKQEIVDSCEALEKEPATEDVKVTEVTTKVTTEQQIPVPVVLVVGTLAVHGAYHAAKEIVILGAKVGQKIANFFNNRRTIKVETKVVEAEPENEG